MLSRGLVAQQCPVRCLKHSRYAVLAKPSPTSAAAAAATTGRPLLHSFSTNAASRKLCLIDGHNLAWRSFYGIFKSPMSALQTADGIPTTVTFGFVRTLLALLEQEQPDAVVIVFDAPRGATFRRELLPAYKAHRVKPPPEFSADLANLQRLLHFARIPTLAIPGYEADDVIAGLAVQAKQAGWRTLLISTDRDLWQVVDDAGGVSVLLPTGSGFKPGGKSGPAQYIDEAAVKQELGVAPNLVPDLKALMGDSSDGIPGIPGIGIKTASKLLQSYSTLEGVFQQSSSQEKPGVAAKLSGRQAEADLYKGLATVRPEAAPAHYDFNSARLQGFAVSEVEPLLRRLQMTSLVKGLDKMQRLMGGTAAADPERLAALPAALEQIAASVSSNSQPSDDQQQQDDVLGVAPEGGPEGASNTAAHDDSNNTPAQGAVEQPSAAAVYETGLADNILANMPCVRLVSTAQGLQQLILQLQQQQQVPVAWCWPQDTPYRPGCRQQPMPQVLCCAWQQPAGSVAAPPGADVSGSSSSSSSSGGVYSNSSQNAAAAAAAGAPAAQATPAAPRRRRRTRAATSMQLQAQQASTSLHYQQTPLQQHVQAAGLQLAVVLPGEGLPAAQVLTALQPLLESDTHPKCLFESKRCFTELHHHGIKLSGVADDVLVAGCLPDPQRWVDVLDPEHQQQSVLPSMAQHVLNTSLQDMADALQAAAGGGGHTCDSVPQRAWQAAAEALATFQLSHSFRNIMQRLGDGGQLQDLLQSIELPVQRVLSAMEVSGVRCDKQVLLKQREQLQAEVTALEQQLYSIAGHPFNLNSPKDCSKVIYEELALKGKGIKKTKSGYLSTSMSEIEKLEDSPFKAAFTEWSRLSTLLSKYYSETFLNAINPDTGRIHTTYQQVGVATGRLASSNPNMQSIPAHDDRGRLIRAAFTADEDHLLVAADYSQVELRVMAGLSGDEALLQAFAQGEDVHASTAREVLGKGPQDALTAEERQLGKRVNFSIVYGAGTRQLASDLGMTQRQAQDFLDKFKAAHPKLYEYKTYCMRSAVARGYTLSVMGRRRLYSFNSAALRGLRGAQALEEVPDMKGLQKHAGRADVHTLLQASNAPIQGTSADILKAALLQLHDRLVPAPYCCRLLLTAHDDVVLEVPVEHLPAVKDIVQATMEKALPQAGLLLRADVTAGPTWLDCK